MRGAILRKLLIAPIKHDALLKIDVEDSYRLELALKDLAREGLIKKKGNTWHLAGD
jgi:hypothetical protein